MKLSDQITFDLYNYLDLSKNQEIIIPNFFVHGYEMDVFKLTNTGYITEFEIKISRSDYFNDFKKGNGFGNKHDLIKSGKGVANRFFYVVPEGLIELSEVPKYCGLAYWYMEDSITKGTIRRCAIRIVKPAPFIHKEKHFKTQESLFSLAIKLAFRETQHRFRFFKIKNQYDEYKSKKDAAQ